MEQRARGAAIPYVGAIDGMRGIAVLAVVLFHLQLTVGSRPLVPAGYLGVDVFFCLSGYLITSLLLAERRAEGRIDLGRFWLRRARRLLPAMFLVVLAVVVVVALDQQTADLLGSQRGAALATLGYAANWFEVARDASYFEAFVTAPLGHTWSLAIEEQFYVVWPVLAALVLRRGRRHLGTIAVVGAVASSVWFVVELHRAGLDRAYYGSDTRLGAILLGAAVAVLVRGRARDWSAATRRGVEAAGLLSGLALLATMVIARDSTTFLGRGGLALAAVLSTVVLIPVSQWRGPLGRTLEAAPLVWLGRLSYSVYLWHVPVIAVLSPQRTGWTGWQLALVRIVVTAVLSVASYQLVEQPVRHSDRPARRLVPAFASVTVALALVAALAVPDVTPVLAATGEDGYVPDPAALAGEPEGPPPSTEPTSPSTTVPDTTSLAPSVHAQPTAPPTTAPPRRVRRALVVGDSVAWSLESQLRRSLPDGLRVTNRGLIGCSIWRGEPVVLRGRETNDHPECDQWPARWSGLLADLDPEVAVLVLGTSGGDRVLDGALRGPCDPQFGSRFGEHLRHAIDVLGSQGAMVALTTLAPDQTESRPTAPEETACLNAAVRAAAEDRGAELLDLAAFVCPDGSCATQRDGVLVRPDGLHFNSKGDPWVGRWLWEQLLDPGRLARHGLAR